MGEMLGRYKPAVLEWLFLAIEPVGAQGNGLKSRSDCGNLS
jgi:hypothetical protein